MRSPHHHLQHLQTKYELSLRYSKVLLTGKNLGGPKGDGESLRPQGERKGGRKDGGKKKERKERKGSGEGERWRYGGAAEGKSVNTALEEQNTTFVPTGPCLDWVPKLGLYPRVLGLPGEIEEMNVRSKNKMSGPGLGRRGAGGFGQLCFSTAEELLFRQAPAH